MSDFKILVQKLGDLTGKPATSKLHKHEFASENNAHLGIPESMDPEVYTVSSVVSFLGYAPSCGVGNLSLTSGSVEQREVVR
jgi:hypothetical protein